MKASELMIGDVVAYNGSICHVTSTESFGGLVGIENEEICDLVADKELSPIPLTKEIMFANSFESRGCKGELVHKTDRKLVVYYETDHFEGADWIVKSWDVFGISGFESVHDYQHYLRLIGRMEMANNFKLE